MSIRKNSDEVLKIIDKKPRKTMKADICEVLVRFVIPETFNSGERNFDTTIRDVELHEKMIIKLHKLKRCRKTCCGHTAWVSFSYNSPAQMLQYRLVDQNRIQQIIDRVTPVK